MKIGIIADDLTGANDTGVQFAKKGLKSSVFMKAHTFVSDDVDALIIDTDSRSVEPTIAYERVKQAVDFLQKQNITLLYKKIDSTMRGNIGVELDAIYNKVKPDFMFIAPGYPETGRRVIQGHLYIHETLVHETDFADDPKNPIENSFIPSIIEKTSNYFVGLITGEDLEKGISFVKEKLIEFKENGVVYIVFDTINKANLQMIAEILQHTQQDIVSVGSAGLADFLIEEQTIVPVKNTPLRKNRLVMSIIGSVNDTTRQQLRRVLESEDIAGVKLHSHLIVKDDIQLQKEMKRVLQLIEQAIQSNKHIVLYSAGNRQAVQDAIEYGEKNGYTKELVSEKISETLGFITKKVLDKHHLDRLFITGGETAKKICDAIGVSEFRLIDEVEKGVPYGVFLEEKIIAITKAGGFGSEDVILKSLDLLKGDDAECARLLE